MKNGVKTFCYEVGRHGIEYLYNRGYSIPQIARIYDVSPATVRTACRALYGVEWKNALKVRYAAYAANPSHEYHYGLNAVSAA